MSSFGDAADRREAAQRRKQRLEEARRRVAAGENTAPAAGHSVDAARPTPKAAPAKGGGRRTRATPSAVDPASVRGGAFGVWRSTQHFCVEGSIPDGESADLEALVRWSGSIMEYRLRQRLVARRDEQDVWQPVCYVKDGRREAITRAQAERYRDGRLGVAQPPNDGYGPLKEGAHPTETEQV